MSGRASPRKFRFRIFCTHSSHCEPVFVPPARLRLASLAISHCVSRQQTPCLHRAPFRPVYTVYPKRTIGLSPVGPPSVHSCRLSHCLANVFARRGNRTRPGTARSQHTLAEKISVHCMTPSIFCESNFPNQTVRVAALWKPLVHIIQDLNFKLLKSRNVPLKDYFLFNKAASLSIWRRLCRSH